MAWHVSSAPASSSLRLKQIRIAHTFSTPGNGIICEIVRLSARTVPLRRADRGSQLTPAT